MAAISRRSGRARRAKADINVVPYIDVMLVLLVIFMVAAPLVNPGVVDLPTVGGAAQQPLPPMLVIVKSNGQYTLRYKQNERTIEEALDRSGLVSAVQRQQTSEPGQPVVIAAEKDLPYDAVMQVMSLLKDEGVQRVGLMVKSR
jgi:biopolymer transport protein TolR